MLRRGRELGTTAACGLGGAGGRVRPLRRLARGSTLLGLSCVGCLQDPPLYTGPIPIPPVVAEPQVEPVLGVVHELLRGEDSLNILVPFRSEDLGSPVLGKFLIDVEPGGESLAVLQSEVRIPASSFTDFSREVRTQVTGLSVYEGCHTLTLVLTQESNTFSFSDRLIDEALATRVEWWFTVPYDDGRPVLLTDCPTVGYQLEPAE